MHTPTQQEVSGVYFHINLDLVSDVVLQTSTDCIPVVFKSFL